MSRNVGGITRRTLVLLVLGGAGAAWPVAFASVRTGGNSRLFDLDARVGGINVGGLSPEDALSHLEAVWAPFLANPAIFKIKG